MKHYLTLLTSLLLFNLATSCTIQINTNGDKDSSKTIVGEGDPVEETINLEDFTKINLVGSAHIKIKNGNKQTVVIKAPKNILDIMVHEVNGDELKIGFEGEVTLKNNEEIEVNITTPSAISDLKIDGAGKIKIEKNKQPELNIIINGAADIDAYGVEVDASNIEINGAGNCNVRVNKELKVVISGTGNVSYKGNPQISQVINGIGRVHKD